MEIDKYSDAGISHSTHDHGDYYTGRKSALIDAGIAKAKWFPSVKQLDRFGRTKRSFSADENGLKVELRDINGSGRWQVYIKASPEEQQRREGPGHDPESKKGWAAVLSLSERDLDAIFDFADRLRAKRNGTRPAQHLRLVVDNGKPCA